MKKITYLLLATAILFSCDDKLDRYPLDKLSDGDFFSTETGLQAFSNAFYSAFPSPDNRSGDMIALDNADNIFTAYQTSEVLGNRQIPSSGSGWSFTTLRNYNTLIDNLYQCSDENVRNNYEAVARFFRAYFYFEKVKRFGDVPWYGTQLASDSEELYKPRDSRELVMQHIIDDLQFAMKYLTSDHTVYTVNKYTAQALLSRVLLFEGTFRKYHNITITSVEGGHDATWYLQQCASVSEDFIKNSGYKLYNTGHPKTDYLDMHSADKYATSDAGCEVILSRNYSATYGSKHSFNDITLVASMDRPGYSRKAIAAYLMADGSRFTDIPGWETMTFYEETQNRDPRLAQSIRTPGYKRIGGTEQEAPKLLATISGYQPIKFVSDPGEGGVKDTYGNSDKDMIVMRAAEVYLNYAEAKAELGQLDDKALALSINPIRARAGMPDMQITATPDPFLINPAWGGFKNTSDPMILEVRRERLVELGQEGHRYYDLMRWKEGKCLEVPMYGMYFPGPGVYDLDGNGTNDVYLYEAGKKDGSIKATYIYELDKDIILSEGTKGMINPYKNSPGNWTENKDYLYPIPYGEIQLNPNLEQNPGWVL